MESPTEGFDFGFHPASAPHPPPLIVSLQKLCPFTRLTPTERKGLVLRSGIRQID